MWKVEPFVLKNTRRVLAGSWKHVLFSYLQRLLPPALLLLVSSSLVEMGAGTGWTVTKRLPYLNSIRCEKNSFLSNNCVSLQNSQDKRSAKMLITKSQFAWNVNDNLKTIKNHTFHQRLNMEPYSNDFLEWLVGMVDGDGTFSVAYQNKSWSLIFKLSLHKRDIQVLYRIKKYLGFGSVTTDKSNMATFRIRDRKVLEKHIFPIFDKYPLRTTKFFYYNRLKQVYFLLQDPCLSKQEKDLQIRNLLLNKPNSSYMSPIWDYLPKNVDLTSQDYKTILTKPWIIGFVEAEGSFYITKKDEKRLVHGFGISQKLDSIVLQGIKHILHIPTKIKYKEKYNYYLLDTTNSRAIQNICEYFNDNLISIKSLDFKIWKRALRFKNNYEKLLKMQELIRKLKK